MNEKCFRLRIVTPEQEIFNDEVVSAVLPGSEGQFGILAKHAPLVSRLTKGVVYIEYADGKCIEIDMEEGYGKVRNNEVVILATSAKIFSEPRIAPKVS